jgi:hypothetical protein
VGALQAVLINTLIRLHTFNIIPAAAAAAVAAARLLRRLQAVPINALQEGRTGSCATLAEGTDAEWCALSKMLYCVATWSVAAAAVTAAGYIAAAAAAGASSRRNV